MFTRSKIKYIYTKRKESSVPKDVVTKDNQNGTEYFLDIVSLVKWRLSLFPMKI
jgi:hypothetical protein